MANCKNCGEALEENAKFCEKCGAATEEATEEKEAAPVEETAEEATTEAPAEEATAEETKAEEAAEEEKKEEPSKAQEAIDKLLDTADSTADMDAKDIEDNKIFSIFAYIGILVLIPLLAAKDSKFGRFHSNQGLVLLIADIVVGIFTGLLGLIPYVGIVFSIIGGLLGLCALALMIIGIINVANGQAKDLPIIGKIRLLK